MIVGASEGRSASAFSFRRGEKTWLLSPVVVRGVLASPVLTAVPGASRRLVGLLGFRGQVVAALEPDGADRTTLLVAAAVVVETQHDLIALIADSVEGLIFGPIEGRLLEPEPLARAAGSVASIEPGGTDVERA